MPRVFPPEGESDGYIYGSRREAKGERYEMVARDSALEDRAYYIQRLAGDLLKSGSVERGTRVHALLSEIWANAQEVANHFERRGKK